MQLRLILEMQVQLICSAEPRVCSREGSTFALRTLPDPQVSVGAIHSKASNFRHLMFELLLYLISQRLQCLQVPGQRGLKVFDGKADVIDRHGAEDTSRLIGFEICAQ